MGMTNTSVTLIGRPGTGIEITVPFALASRKVAANVITTYGVGTTADPELTDAQWILRDQIETAANPFVRH